MQKQLVDGIIEIMKKEILSVDEMHDFGMRLGAQLKGGDVLELVGDVGAGKTTLTKGIAEGLGVTEDVQSPGI
jgi:tRNA threonylcarbamoyladenosine biosynthesis protein TsaE